MFSGRIMVTGSYHLLEQKIVTELGDIYHTLQTDLIIKGNSEYTLITCFCFSSGKL